MKLRSRSDVNDALSGLSKDMSEAMAKWLRATGPADLWMTCLTCKQQHLGMNKARH